MSMPSVVGTVSNLNRSLNVWVVIRRLPERNELERDVVALEAGRKLHDPERALAVHAVAERNLQLPGRQGLRHLEMKRRDPEVERGRRRRRAVGEEGAALQVEREPVAAAFGRRRHASRALRTAAGKRPRGSSLHGICERIRRDTVRPAARGKVTFCTGAARAGPDRRGCRSRPRRPRSSFGLAFVDQLIFNADCAQLRRVIGRVAETYARGLAPAEACTDPTMS